MHEISACNRLSFFFYFFLKVFREETPVLSLCCHRFHSINTPHNINIHNLYNRPEEEC